MIDRFKELRKKLAAVNRMLSRVKLDPKLRKMVRFWNSEFLKVERQTKGSERPMKCVCGRLFKFFRTWYPHFKKSHPRMWKRYTQDKTRFGRIGFMIKLMRAADKRAC